MNYPLSLSFKIVTVAPQFSVRDALGNLVFYVKQKAFKLKESVTVFADEERTRPVAIISADRIIDWSATYSINGSDGTPIGKIRRSGTRSLWKAHYEILGPQEQPLFSLREENPWSKVMDGLLMQIPLMGMVSGYLFHPRYRVSRADGTPVLRARKEAAFWEGKYSVDRVEEIAPGHEVLAVLSLMMMVLLERRRG